MPLNLEVPWPHPTMSAECDRTQLVVTAGQGWGSISCRVTVSPGAGDDMVVTSSTDGSPVPSSLEHRTSVSSLRFGPEGGTQHFEFSARGGVDEVGFHPVEMLVRGTGANRVTFAFMVQVKPPPA